MKFRIIKEHGDVIITDKEIVSTIYDQLLMIPGIKLIGCANLRSRLLDPSPINVYQVRTNSIGISVHVCLSQYVNAIETSRGVQENIKFIVEKKYGLIVDHVDVNIEGIENAR